MAIKKRNIEALKEAGYSDEDLRVINDLEKKAVESEKDLARLQESDAPIKDILRAKKEHQRLVNMYCFAGVDPADIPRKTLLELAKEPDWRDNVEKVYRDRIKNPMTAIRAFCVLCMGGQPSMVRKCEKTNCPLWALRLGKNNLSTRRGIAPKHFNGFKKKDVEDEIEYEDDNDDDLEEVIVPDDNTN